MVLTSVLRDLVRGPSKKKAPLLSVVVNFYNNRREAQNTLYSLLRRYQNGAEEMAYEVIAIDKWDPLESTCRHASLSIL